MAQYRNVVFTWNNPDGLLEFDDERMEYLVYQEEIGETGTYHFQGYCEFTNKLSLNSAKALLGGASVHLERRRGNQTQAIAYAKKEETRVDGPYEYGIPRSQGKRVDLEGFKDAVTAGKRKRDLVDDHFLIMARYPKFYDTLTMMNRPTRETDLRVTLHIGPTGLGKTRTVMDQFSDDPEFYIAPLANNTQWYDTYDGHKRVLMDDFTGASSHMALCTLLRLLDRYPVLVPTKGSHTWWLPDEIYITTNILPKDWYKWENRAEQYRALARRIHRVKTFWQPFNALDQGHQWEGDDWWKENCPTEASHLYLQ